MIPRYIRRPLRHASNKFEPMRKMAAYRVLGRKIDRNQWRGGSGYIGDLWKEYRYYMDATWEEIEAAAPDFHARLNFAVSRARGCVLEIGCGIGMMTRWLSRNPEVEHIFALDGFDEAIIGLKQYQIKKVTPLLDKVDAFDLPPTSSIDTVLICEVIEHLYPDEERLMIANLKRFSNNRTRYIISTPIGYLPDPFHVRGFSARSFRKHLQRAYGQIDEINVIPGYVQEAVGVLSVGGPAGSADGASVAQLDRAGA